MGCSEAAKPGCQAGHAGMERGRVKAHCRNLHAPRPRAKKSKKANPRQKQLNALIRKRDATQNCAKYNELNIGCHKAVLQVTLIIDQTIDTIVTSITSYTYYYY
eukprot:COSAG06_NODE_8_length_37897_cov_42.611884_8_plen_104_part_00